MKKLLCLTMTIKACKNYCIHMEVRHIYFYVTITSKRVPITCTQSVLLCLCVSDFHTKSLYVFLAPTAHTVCPSHRNLLHINFPTPLPPGKWYCPPHSICFSYVQSRYFLEKFILKTLPTDITMPSTLAKWKHHVSESLIPDNPRFIITCFHKLFTAPTFWCVQKS